MSSVFGRFLAALFNTHESSYYYDRDRLRNKYKDISPYRSLCWLSEPRESLLWNQDIYCSGHIGFGISAAAFKLNIGRPQQQVTDVNKVTNMLLVYRHQINDYKMKSEFHFSGDRLFYFNRTFSYLSQIQKPKLINVLREKYNNGKPIDFSSQKIVDPSGNELIVSHNVVLSIDYIGKQESVWLDILNDLENTSSAIFEKDEREFDRLYRTV